MGAFEDAEDALAVLVQQARAAELQAMYAKRDVSAAGLTADEAWSKQLIADEKWREWQRIDNDKDAAFKKALALRP